VLTGSRPSKPSSRSSNPTHQIVFHAFDVLHVNGRDVTGEPLMKRRARLPEIIELDSSPPCSALQHRCRQRDLRHNL
jgi:ATP-dependent DNA ligase